MESNGASESAGDENEGELLRALAAAPAAHAVELAARALPQIAGALRAGELHENDVPKVGDVVGGRYRIDEPLGAGGMGIVFAATHVATGRKVALKWVLARREGMDADWRAAAQRFVREAQAVGRIRHPNVVDVYDAGTEPDAPFLVMERLEGETLRTRIERGPVSWVEALALLVPAMRGVAEAHRQGVVHRDLKPDNVFLARTSSGEIVPKVLDFGVSRLRLGDAHEATLTRPGAVIGTPAYMSLEQLRGDEAIDERADIYALGVMLYEMLAGARPYSARNAADFAALIASAPPVPLVQQRPELRGGREAAVMKALGRRPEDRYPSVDAFLAALSRDADTRTRTRWITALAALCVLGACWMWRATTSMIEHSVAAQRRAAASASAPVTAKPVAPAPVPNFGSRLPVESPRAPVAQAAQTPIAPRPIVRRKLAAARRSDVARSPAAGAEPAPLPRAGEAVAPNFRLDRDEF